MSGSTRKGKGFFKALALGKGRRSKASRAQEGCVDVSGSGNGERDGDDASISLPWNFQVRWPFPSVNE